MAVVAATNNATTAAVTPTPTAKPLAAAAPRTMPGWRRNSVRRRCRRSGGSAARWAAKLLNGAAAKPRVGMRGSAASSGPLSVVGWLSAAAIPATPHVASTLFARLALITSPPGGLVERLRRPHEHGCLGEQSQNRGTCDHRDVRQMKKAPAASLATTCPCRGAAARRHAASRSGRARAPLPRGSR